MPASPPEGKKVLPPTTALYPVPAVLVSCAGQVEGERKENLLAIAWAGVACSDPPMVSVAIRKNRFSHGLIASTREFVVNIPTADMKRVVDLCGTVSGRDGDKFARAGLHQVPSSVVSAPLIAECPVALECRVRHIYEAGSHDLFIGEVVAVVASEAVLGEGGKIDVALVDPLGYGGGTYWRLGPALGTYGQSQR